MLNYFSPSDFYHPVDPYEAYIREQEARRLSERRRRMQQQQPSRFGRFASPSYYFDDDVVEAPYRDDEYDHEGSTHHLVRGRDGRIYRVPVKSMAQPKKKPLYSIVRGRDGRLYRVSLNSSDNDTIGKEITEEDSLHRTPRSHGKHGLVEPFRRQKSSPALANQHPEDLPELAAAELSVESTRMKPSRATKSKNKKVTVIVEDASDSEGEDDARQSVWRNRLPSPGQWMEPVETLYEL